MDNPIISIENLGKCYKLGLTHTDLISERLAYASKSIYKKIKQKLNKDNILIDNDYNIPAIENYWALKNISIDIYEGDVIGVIGHNGAGKSTLLKILSQITDPTEGRIRIRGKVGSLLEVGTGFHPELTGKENIYLNGAILGMNKSEIDSKFSDIIEFSEIGKFLDTPVKRYSSGMYVRLAFAVAANLTSDILFVDEVLAVGDFKFQNKCLNKMNNLSKSGRTILLVSHRMESILSLCNKTIWIHDGRIHRFGETEEVIGAYLKSGSDNINDEKVYSDKKRNITIKNIESTIKRVDRSSYDLKIRMEFICRKIFDGMMIGIKIENEFGVRIATFRSKFIRKWPHKSKNFKLKLKKENINCFLSKGNYYITIWANDKNNKVNVAAERACMFTIPFCDPYISGHAYEYKNDGIVPLEFEYKFDYPNDEPRK